MPVPAVIGIDAGNTKTAVACATLNGALVAAVRGGRANYQTTGPGPALDALLSSVLPVADAAAAAGVEVVAFGAGLTGLDRPRDLAVLDPLCADLATRVAARVPVAPGAPRVLRNDAFLVLRAGTDDGVGVAVSSGTGGNCVGQGGDGCRVQVGGLGWELGDGGGAHDIAMSALRAAGRARDGRGPPTLLTDFILAALSIERIEDVMDFAIPGNEPAGFERSSPREIAMFAPFVFEAARQGDAVAHRVLADTGRELGLAARVAAAKIGFGPGDPLPLVLGGSVLCHAADPVFADAIVGDVRSAFPRVRPAILEHPPVLGALLLAIDASGEPLRPQVRDSLGRELDETGDL
ncbi:MAG: hypothetical protein FJ087_17655 [Deltaproteobacteria bacterium]|nr:hypothetical protein [Deltaproteobacteria bacterium]